MAQLLLLGLQLTIQRRSIIYVLMGTVAQNFRDIVYFQYVNLPLAYATQVLNKNHTGLISIQQIAKDPVLIRNLVPFSISLTNNTNAITNTLAKEFRNLSGYVSIDRQLKPLLIKKYENDTTASNLSKCNDINGCIMWARSEFNLEPNLSIIGNVSKNPSEK